MASLQKKMSLEVTFGSLQPIRRNFEWCTFSAHYFDTIIPPLPLNSGGQWSLAIR